MTINKFYDAQSTMSGGAIASDKSIILSALQWAIDNHLTKAGAYWGKDYSSLAYDDEGIVREFLKSLPAGPAKESQPDAFCQMLIKAREAKGLSIRDAEDGAHIPHGYLAQLEAGKYNQPSAHALYNLANLYETELKPLLVAGGLIVKKDVTNRPLLKPQRDSYGFYCHDDDHGISEEKCVSQCDDCAGPRPFPSIEATEPFDISLIKQLQEERRKDQAEIASLQSQLSAKETEAHEYRKALRTLEEGYSDNWTEFIQKHVRAVLDKYPLQSAKPRDNA